MKWIHRNTCARIQMQPNDRLELVYDLDYEVPVVTKRGRFGRAKTVKEMRHLHKVLGNYPVDKFMSVDVVGVVEFDEEELESLGLKDALVGVFGESNGEMVADVRITEDEGKALLDREGLCYAA